MNVDAVSWLSATSLEDDGFVAEPKVLSMANWLAFTLSSAKVVDR